MGKARIPNEHVICSVKVDRAILHVTYTKITATQRVVSGLFTTWLSTAVGELSVNAGNIIILW